MTARIAVQLDGDLLGILICFHRLNQKSRHFYDRYRVEIEKDTRISTFLYFNTKLIYVIFVSIRSAALGKEQVEKLGLLSELTRSLTGFLICDKDMLFLSTPFTPRHEVALVLGHC